MSRLPGWTPRKSPGVEPTRGERVLVEPILDDRRFGELFAAYGDDREMWHWMAYGPFPDEAAFLDFARRTYLGGEALFHAIIPNEAGTAAGVAALMRTDASHGVTEIGNIALGASLRQTPAATEAFFLILRHVFDDLGYRRLEWKCDHGNVPSKRAAERLGFTFEGIFRQHMVIKGRSRDTAWFSIIDKDWPTVKSGFEAWLDPSNFGANGLQRRSLSEVRSSAAGKP